MTKTTWIVAAIVVALLTGHAVSGFFFGGIPAWTMFKTQDNYAYALFDRNGAPLDIRDYVPKRAYLCSDSDYVFLIARWIGKRQPERLPLRGTLEVRSGDLSFGRGRTLYQFRVTAGGENPLLYIDRRETLALEPGTSAPGGRIAVPRFEP